jgi:cytochrome c oxidase subunit 3
MTIIAQGAPDGSHEHEHASDVHAKHKHLAHHFDTPIQQYDSGKLGTWLFLTTEILLFSGLFCAYAVYRATHPEIFEFAHQYLDKTLGALNTLILIFSSFTMAWGVRAAQLGQRKLCTTLLGITILCGAGFMCVKGVEYNAKWKEALLPGEHYNPTEMPGAVSKAEAADAHLAAAESKAPGVDAAAVAATTPAFNPLKDNAPAIQKSLAGYTYEESAISRAAVGPEGLNPSWASHEDARVTHEKFKAPAEEVGPEPNNAQIFFGIYFLMTGLHGLHVLAGMSLIGWCMYRSNRGDFGPGYFSPVDFVGLYWHVVDLVWIFLFPLLYLIT